MREEIVVAVKDFGNMLISVLKQYATSDEGIATILILFVIILKLLINQQVTALHFKKSVVAVPSEITFLVIGFVLSSILSKQYTNNIRGHIATIVMALVILVIQYAVERYLDDKLSGNWSASIRIWVICMYVLTIILYGAVVFGGMN